MKTRTQAAIEPAIREIVGSDSVSSSPDDLARHSYDAWPKATKWQLRGVRPFGPELIVQPTTIDHVSRLLAWASENNVSVTPWGLGSSVTGAPLPLRGGVSLDMSAMHALLMLDETNLFVRVQSGKLGIELEEELNTHGYTLGHSPQSLARSTVGGWVATRASGQFSSRYGSIEDLLVGLTVVLPDGEVVETPMVPRLAAGPDVRQLFVGSEGTLGVIVEVALKIFPVAQSRLLETVRFPTVEAGVDAMRRIMRAGLRPFLVRFYDEDETRHAMAKPGLGGCVMFLGVEGLASVAAAEFDAARSICDASGGERLGPPGAEAWMGRRFDFSTVENLLAEPGGFAETIEVAHFWDQSLELYRAMKQALAPLADEVLGHFSHLYPQGTSLYLILLGHAEDDAAAEAAIGRIWDTAMRVALEHGAAISHHHGVGIARLPYVRAALGSAMIPLRRLKQALDPANVMNPGKLGL